LDRAISLFAVRKGPKLGLVKESKGMHQPHLLGKITINEKSISQKADVALA
jgi:hypothetical protein